jgi:TP901 family phage tail tape measure protein
MATLQQVVQLVFEGIDNASSATKSVGSALNELDGKVSALAAPFGDLADKILKLDAVLLGAAVTIGVLSVKEAAKFETALADLQKVLGEGEGQAGQYADRLKELALQYGVNANELVLSAADFRRSGNEIETSVKLVKQALDLMLAGGVSAAEATEILKASLAGFQIPADQTTAAATRIGDVLNFIADNSESSFRELATGFRDIAPVAKLTGLSFEEVAAALAVVIGVGNSGAEAANGLGVSFARLIGPTGAAAEVMKDLGVTFDATGKPIGSVKTILEAIIPTWNTLTDEQKFNNAATIVGLEQAKRFIPLLDGWAKAQDLVGKATEGATGSVEYQVKVALATAEVQFGKTSEAVRQLAQTIGANLLPAAADASGGVTEMTTAFQRLIENGKLDPFFDLINKALERLGVTFRDVAKNLPEAFENVDLSGLLDALEGVGAEVRVLFRELFGEIDVSTPEGLANVIQRIVDGFTLLTRVTEGIISQFRPLFALIRESIDNFTQLDDASQLEFGQFLGAMKLITDLGPKVAAALLLIAQTTIDMEDVIRGGFGAITIAANAFQVAFDGVAWTVVQGARGLGAYALALAELDAYMNRNSESAQEYRDRADRLRGVLDDLGVVAEAIGENFKRNAEELRGGWNKVIGETDEKSEATRGTLERTRKAIQDFGETTFNASKEILDFVDEIEDLGAAIKRNLSDLDYRLTIDSSSVPRTVEDVEDLTNGVNFFQKAAEDAAFGTDKFVQSVEDIGGSAKDADTALKGIEWGKAADNADKLADNIQRTDGVLIEAGKSTDEYAASLEGVSTEYRNVGDGTVRATGAFAEVKTNTKDAAQALDELTQSGKLSVDELLKITGAANDFQVKMEEIASNERIKMIEAVISLDVARLEAETKQVEAAFDSISTTIESTAEVLNTLYGLWGDADTTRDKRKLEGWIDQENRRRDEAMEMQNKLIQTQIDSIKARTDAMNRGDAMITVNGDGLRPHLEAFMWEVLSSIQVQASADMQEFLLNIGTGG